MSSNEESQFAVGGSATRKTWRTKLLLAVVSAVGVAVVVAACAAVVVASRGEKGGVVDTGVDSVVEWESPGMQLQGRRLPVGGVVPKHLPRDTKSAESTGSGEEEGEEEGEERENPDTNNYNRRPHAQRSHTNSAGHPSCDSTYGNNAVPAAHIMAGKQGIWEGPSPESGQNYNGYQQFWRCSVLSMPNEPPSRVPMHAFVDGGMRFDQTSKQLHFPACGYYYIYSQISFKGCQHHPRTVFYNLNIRRNCTMVGVPDNNKITVQGVSSLVNGTWVTTYTGDIIKVCKGGVMWVEIPDAVVPCHPWGDQTRTFMGTVLIAPTEDCTWPPQHTLY